MRVYLNFTERPGPYGGANSFLRALVGALGRHGVTVTTDPRAPVDVALVNALTGGIGLEEVRRIAERGVPVVHRKTGYRGRGSPGLRAIVGGVVVGDRLQLDLSPHVRHTIFQSRYSRDVFSAGGFGGSFSIVANGVDESIFNQTLRPRLGSSRQRSFWHEGQPLRVVVSTWSTDETKGFRFYRAIDAAFAKRRDVELTLVGRAPEGARFRAFRRRRARGAARLAEMLKRQHVLLQLTEHESCSNALIEGLNCGLPAVYLDSGANDEVARNYGVRWEGDLDEALDRLRPRYGELMVKLPTNPYRISLVVERYLEILTAVADGREPQSTEHG